jgi:hypothetical protein
MCYVTAIRRLSVLVWEGCEAVAYLELLFHLLPAGRENHAITEGNKSSPRPEYETGLRLTALA